MHRQPASFGRRERAAANLIRVDVFEPSPQEFLSHLRVGCVFAILRFRGFAILLATKVVGNPIEFSALKNAAVASHDQPFSPCFK
jgi:hypothetical protein